MVAVLTDICLTLHYLNLFDEKRMPVMMMCSSRHGFVNNTNSAYISLGDTAIFFTKYSVPDAEEAKHNYITIDKDFCLQCRWFYQNRVQNVTFKNSLIRLVSL